MHNFIARWHGDLQSGAGYFVKRYRGSTQLASLSEPPEAMSVSYTARTSFQRGDTPIDEHQQKKKHRNEAVLVCLYLLFRNPRFRGPGGAPRFGGDDMGRPMRRSDRQTKKPSSLWFGNLRLNAFSNSG